MVLMFQKEVAERIVARAGDKTYSRLAIISQWRCETRILFNLPARAFTPPPKVNSAIVEFRPRTNPLDAGGSAMLEKVTAAAFGQRRKMLRASLKNLPGAIQALDELGLDPVMRAEQLSVADFCNLSARIAMYQTNTDR
jgi:16S rRNA (adenine1518-N6/adenine1519-N6)-dimethyltransferase